MTVIIDASESRVLSKYTFKFRDKKTRKQIRKTLGLRMTRDELKNMLLDIMKIQEDIYLTEPTDCVVLHDLSKRLASIWEEWYNGEKILEDK